MQIVVSGKSKLKPKKALFDKKGVFIFKESSSIYKKYRFIFLTDPLPIIKVMANNQPVYALLDTGADAFIVD